MARQPVRPRSPRRGRHDHHGRGEGRPAVFVMSGTPEDAADLPARARPDSSWRSDQGFLRQGARATLQGYAAALERNEAELMYDKNDPRSALAAPPPAGPTPTGLVAEQQAGLFYDADPATDDAVGQDLVSPWLQPGAVGWSDARPAAASRAGPGRRIRRPAAEAGHGATITWNGATTEVPGFRSPSSRPATAGSRCPTGGPLCRIFTVKSKDLVALCTEPEAYARPRTHIPPFEPWPEPREGWSGAATTASTCRRSRAASAGSSAAPRSW